jgi:hypothetical protein
VDAADEIDVELDSVGLDVGEEAEACPARAEVVECDTEPHLRYSLKMSMRCWGLATFSTSTISKMGDRAGIS